MITYFDYHAPDHTWTTLLNLDSPLTQGHQQCIL